MGRKTAVELDEKGEASYFRSMEEAARALHVLPRTLKAALDTGKFIKGTRVKARSVPWTRLQKDRKFYTICYSIPWTYRCGLDKIAEEMGLTFTGLMRHCVTSTFTEEYIWQKALETGLLMNEKFQPLPLGKPRVRLITEKRKRKPKHWKAEYKDVSTGAGRPSYRDHKWRDRKAQLSKKEIELRLSVETLARRERLLKQRIRGLRDEIAVRHRDGRFASQHDADRLPRDSGHNE